MPAAQPHAAGAGTAPGGGATAGSKPPESQAARSLGLLPLDPGRRRQKLRSLVISLALQVGLWLALFSSFGRARFAPARWRSPPEKLTWLAAPPFTSLSPPLLAARRPHRAARRLVPPLHPAVRRRGHRQVVGRGRPEIAPRLSAPEISAPVFVAGAALPSAPDPANQPAVVMQALPRIADPRPPQPALHAAVRLGAFADPPALRDRAREALVGQQLGVFGAVARAARAVRAAVSHPAEVRLGRFHAGPPVRLGPAHAASATLAARINTRVFRPAMPPARPASARARAPAAGYEPPVILSKPQPAYPASAMAHGVEGVVVLRVVLMASGRVRVVSVERSLGAAFDRAARRAALGIRFRPARRDGRWVDAVVRILVRFRVAN